MHTRLQKRITIHIHPIQWFASFDQTVWRWDRTVWSDFWLDQSSGDGTRRLVSIFVLNFDAGFMIRQMTESDWESVSRIWGESIDAGDATFRTELTSYESWDNSHEKCCRLVYEEDGKVLGFAVIGSMSGTPAYWGSVEDSIYVDRTRREKGIGTRLLNELIIQSEANGYWSLYAVIFSSNIASIRLHEKCGFRIIGTRDRPARDRFGNWTDTTLMERRSDKVL